ncbi:ABC transporter ATP-binding protein [Halobacillus trueperi]|uniref:ATP-binding cassette domain-containing protein n=1 Tax=Halobacillus trueperi TaxID=156205 RepID=A0A3E0J2I0_9BACI|nr:ABC transporter ATP-binding protein [Halobacillus trueperi]REJ07135.1 ATP-binding cassette domain-containing protein [Halobacillus trueperi]
MNQEVIRVEDLTLHYEERQKPVLSRLNFCVEEGENLLILGPSGSGKSSLTHCLNGLYPRELDGSMDGEVHVKGRRTDSYPAGEMAQNVGVVFQDPETQFCMITVEDEVAFGLENLNTPYASMVEKVDTALRSVGMEDYKTANISELSGGQKQKVALACILAMEPEVLILDEPTANLDPVARKEFIQLLKTLKKELSFTLLVIEHKLEGWLDLLERVLIINGDGELAYDGPLHDRLITYAREIHEMGIQLPYATRTALERGWTPPYPLHIEEMPPPASLQENPRPAEHKNEELLKVENVHWKSILRNINVTFHEGEWVAIVGENGSGKSSLSRILAGIQSPSMGTVSLGGRSLKKWKENDLRQEVGYVFQNPEHQFIADAVYDEVAFSLQHAGMKEAEWTRIVEEILKFCRLDGLEDQHPFLLSQGQKRRLSVATMIIEDQRLLFLDEPTFGQDEKSTSDLMSLLKENNENGTTIVMITHDMELVDKYATRVLVMNEGELTFDDRPERLWSRSDLADHHLELPPREQWKRSVLKRKEPAYVSS